MDKGGRKIRISTYENKNTRNVHACEHLFPALIARFGRAFESRAAVESPDDNHEKPERRDLQRQPANKHVFADFDLFTFPVAAAGNTRSARLSQEADDITRDENFSQKARRDAVEGLMTCGEHGGDEAGYEHVEGCGDEERSDYDEGGGGGVEGLGVQVRVSLCSCFDCLRRGWTSNWLRRW